MSEATRRTARRWSCPETAKIAARALIKHGMNATQTAKELRPHLTYESARKTGSRMMKTPAVQRELEKQVAEALGLDDASRDKFLSRMAAWLDGDDVVRATTAARIFARVYFANRIAVEKPEPLLIGGLEEGIKRMLGPVGTEPKEREDGECPDEPLN